MYKLFTFHHSFSCIFIISIFKTINFCIYLLSVILIISAKQVQFSNQEVFLLKLYYLNKCMILYIYYEQISYEYNILLYKVCSEIILYMFGCLFFKLWLLICFSLLLVNITCSDVLKYVFRHENNLTDCSRITCNWPCNKFKGKVIYIFNEITKFIYLIKFGIEMYF